MAKVTLTPIEKELRAAVAFKPKDNEEPVAYLTRLVALVQDLGDDDWKGLSKEAKRWMNKAADAINEEDDIPKFPDAAADADDDDAPAKKKSAKATAEDEDEAPKKKSVKDESDEDEVPAKKKSAKADADDDEDEKPVKRKPVKDDDEDDAPKGKRRAAKEEPETEDEDEPMAKKAAKKTPAKAVAEKPAKKAEKTESEKIAKKLSGVKFDITKMVAKKPSISVDDLMAALKKADPKMKLSKITVTAVRTNVRHTIASLNQIGMLEIDL